MAVLESWICWNVIALFDPIIFSTLLAAIALWVTRLVSPRIVFPILYVWLVLYYIWRIRAHRRVVQGVAEPGTRNTRRGVVYGHADRRALPLECREAAKGRHFPNGHWKRER